MKVEYSSKISSFGGLYFVLNKYSELKIDELLQSHLPQLKANSNFNWKDIFYSLSSIYYCGGDYVEDAKTVLSNQIDTNPIFNLCSSSTIRRRLKELATPIQTCRTPRGEVEHEYNLNPVLADLNMKWLINCGEFKRKQIVLDYDNTIIFTEKKDSKMSYKKQYGYQPGVCFLNENKILYLENRNGNSDAKSFQADSLKRMFNMLKQHGVNQATKFRADSASYQFEVIEVIGKHVEHFYIAVRNSYIEKYFSEIINWRTSKDKKGDVIQIGSIRYTPFLKRYKSTQQPKEYRLLVKRKRRTDGKGNLFTNDAYDYHAVSTNDFESDVKDGLDFYYRRGITEREFDTLKNEFGWQNLPFSKLGQNTVFLFLTALMSNIYKTIVIAFSKKYKLIKSTYRMKRFRFLLITIPAKWIYSARSWYLKIYGKIELEI